MRPSLTQEQKEQLSIDLTTHIQANAVQLAAGAIEAAFGAVVVQQVIYIAGPMNGLEEEVVKANFYGAEAMFTKLGFRVLNPRRMDDEDPIEGAIYQPKGEPPTPGLRKVVLRDSEAVAQSDFIALMQGWQFSRGAVPESHLARWLGLPAYVQEADGGWALWQAGSW